MEINFSHGDPLDLADQVFLFKRTVREAALRHEHATPPSWPSRMENEPGSAMHIHQSIVDAADRPEHLQPTTTARRRDAVPPLHRRAADATCRWSMPLLRALRELLPPALARCMSAPINVQWGYDNRTCGLRVPGSDPANRRRREPRARRRRQSLPGHGAPPLACGYLGMMESAAAHRAHERAAPGTHDHELPSHLEDALRRMRECEPMRGRCSVSAFVDAFLAVKELEYATYNRVISSWEREHLLLLV
ncbi:MAG: hypothetical protein MZW92_06275 [Comamonadaceae bacterium]|nr:hypothetical protein [Comamonadaceae bacterium]